jgi:NhaP-type Na+/H+ or K+/H+ antiporter
MGSLASASPSLTVALALLAGMICEAAARHLRVPGIVPLLVAGVLLGPDVAGIVRPETLGPALRALVGFAVAVILFEGGMSLSIRRLRREALGIRRLVTYGTLLTAAGGFAIGRLVLDWKWRPALLFGTLVMVTGPTVVRPLLRQIRVSATVSTVLEAEGIFADAFGAMIAFVALEIALRPTGGSIVRGLGSIAFRLGAGAAMGAAAGALIALMLQTERFVPRGLENVLALAAAIALYQASGALVPESGIPAVIAGGMVVGNVRTAALDDLRDFKEQLTVLLIGLIFILLAADVRMADVRGLGKAGVLAVALLILVVRPLSVMISTAGTGWSAREKALLCWIAPRGIVAATIASLFAERLDDAGIPGGPALQAMVFLVIAATVLTAGTTGGLVARLLGLRRPSDNGYVILGGGPVGMAIARLLRGAGEDVVLIDANPHACRSAESEGFRVLFGSAFSESLLARAELDSRAGVIAATTNEEANVLFVRTARRRFKVPRAWAALRSGQNSVTPAIVRQAGGAVLFGVPRRVEAWASSIELGAAPVSRWTLMADADERSFADLGSEDDAEWGGLPLAIVRGDKAQPAGDDAPVRQGNEVLIAIADERREMAETRLAARGFSPVADASEG